MFFYVMYIGVTNGGIACWLLLNRHGERKETMHKYKTANCYSGMWSTDEGVPPTTSSTIAFICRRQPADRHGLLEKVFCIFTYLLNRYIRLKCNRNSDKLFLTILLLLAYV